MRLFTDVASRIEDPYLRHAAALAIRAQGATAPNPIVGCVVVSDGRIVGEGYHPRAGEPHAEVFALTDAGTRACGADVYVTLEPCRHHGRTPPCTEALIAAGVSRVVVGMADPNAMAGDGARVLRERGIEVEFAEDPAPFMELNEGWLKRLSLGVPFVRVKVALSLDAKLSFSAGEPASITGTAGARVTRLLRESADAVLVGAATVRSDDPALTVRNEHGRLAEHQPLRVAVSRSGALPLDANLLADGAAPTLLLLPSGTARPAQSDLAEHVVVEPYDAEAGLAGALRVLGNRGVNEVLVETGPRLLSSMWAERLIDELVVVSAGGMAGAEAPSLFLGEPDREGDGLLHRMKPVGASIVGDVSVVAWRRG